MSDPVAFGRWGIRQVCEVTGRVVGGTVNAGWGDRGEAERVAAGRGRGRYRFEVYDRRGPAA